MSHLTPSPQTISLLAREVWTTRQLGGGGGGGVPHWWSCHTWSFQGWVGRGERLCNTGNANEVHSTVMSKRNTITTGKKHKGANWVNGNNF